MLESGDCLTLLIVRLFEFCWWDATDRFEQPMMIEPVDPFQCGDLNVSCPVPGVFVLDDFGLVKADYCLSQSVVVAVTATAD